MSKNANVVDVLTIMDKVKSLSPEDFDEGMLDEAVHQAASEDASAANNAGVQAQVVFLLERGYTVEDVLLLIGDVV